jgi:predicted ester cyclase
MTIFYALFQGQYGVHDDAALVSVFSTESGAKAFEHTLSVQHTELKREAAERRNLRLDFAEIPDLYWDVRPVVFDPRSEEEL